MRTFDLSPLYRYSVGFDRMNRLFDAVARWDEASAAYPPYNILRTGENSYQIAVAVAGFSSGDLEVMVKENTLVIAGRRDEDAGEGAECLHQGIAAEPFERKFELADDIRVDGARLANGMLTIELVREIPDWKKPRAIAIEGGGAEAIGPEKAA